jgi:uncharacterized membrane protein SpoIIM required for sporulation
MNYPSFWKNASSRRKRAYSFILIFVISILVTIIGSFVPLSAQDSKQIYDSLNQTVTQNLSSGTLAPHIFVNNFSLCLAMFIPLLGAFFGLFVLFNTGVALGAELRIESASPVQGSVSTIQPSTAVLVLVLIGLVFLLEYVSYSIGITESIWLFRRLMQHQWRELKNTAIVIGICAVLLVVGALVETYVISLAG